MKPKLYLAYKFILPTIIIFSLMALFLSYFITSVVKQTMIDRAATFVVDFIQIQARKYITSDQDFSLSNPVRTTTIYSQLLADVKTKEVVRIKVWDRKATVIYSDDTQLIGRQFPDNHELQEALEGKIQTEIKKPQKVENIDEKSYGQLMEVYVPIYSEDMHTPGGIIEVYFTLDQLNKTILEAQYKIILLIVSVFLITTLILWLLVNLLIIRPIHKLEEGIKEIEKGNFGKDVSIHSHDELGALGDAFNTMAKGLKRLQELKNEFVFVAAHEIRVPVTSIRGFLYLINNEREVTWSDTVKHYLDIIWQSNERLTQLVNDLLEVARSDAGKLQITISPVDIAEIVKTTITELNPLLDEKHISVTYAAHETVGKVLADQTRLKEVLINLLSNAIKYGKESGNVTITHTSDATTITTQVKDNGIGIPQSEQSHVFEKFFRSQNTGQEQGTGLGLFIAKELIEKMNGSIWFTSKENEGTTFSFLLQKEIQK